MQSVVVFEKPIHHISLPDWEAKLYELQVTADTRRNDAFDLRHSSRQLRLETDIKTDWDTYHNNNRLKDRIYNLEQWRSTIQDLLDKVKRESDALKEEKASTERELEQLNMPLLVTSECLSSRDGRRGAELTYDTADTELKKELCVTESNRKMLIDRCQNAWEKINKLENIMFKLQLYLNDNKEALLIDNEMLTLNKDCANITNKPDPLRTPDKMISAEQWLETAEATKRMAEQELHDVLTLRESLFVARGRARNALRAQTDVTNYTMRLRIYETQRARNELAWQKMKIASVTVSQSNEREKTSSSIMEENMENFATELTTLREALQNKINALKLAETRLETRNVYRPGYELANDEADVGLKEEVLNLRQTIKQLEERLDCAKATYNALEDTCIRIGIDLDRKNQSLETDIRSLEMRAALESKKDEGTVKNIVLANLQDELPKN